jgi:hypothetical protein
MQRLLIATLMALFFGLFSMPALQAAPANGWAVGSAVKAISPLDTIYYRRRRYRRSRRRRYRRYRCRGPLAQSWRRLCRRWPQLF